MFRSIETQKTISSCSQSFLLVGTRTTPAVRNTSESKVLKFAAHLDYISPCEKKTCVKPSKSKYFQL
eukprot:UN18799